MEDQQEHKFNFTLLGIDRLPPATRRSPDYYYDLKVPGLWLRVTRNGVKTFCVKRWIHTASVTVTLGRFSATATQPVEFETNPLCILSKNPLLTVEHARRLAIAVVGELSTGKNPNETKLQARGEMTFGDLFDEYIERHAKKSRKTWAVMVQDFNRDLAHLKHRKLSDISHTEAEKLHGQLGSSKGTFTANRRIQLARAIYNKGRVWKLFLGDNPFSGITLFTEKPRERFLSDEEAASLLKVLDTETEDYIRDFIHLSLFTGLRKANLSSLRWSDIDFDSQTLTIPDTKNSTSQIIALGIAEMKILKDRSDKVKGKFVFPGKGKTGHLIDPKRSWHRVRSNAKIVDCTIHDLRRSLGAGLANHNINVALVKSILNHKDMKTTLAVYARTHKDAERQARESVQNEWLRAAGLLEEKDNVIPLKTGT